MATFVPFRNPDVGLSGDLRYRFQETKFGDGYSARLADGINGQDENYNPVWANILPDDAKSLEDFFNEHEGWKSFEYTIPYELTPKRFICRGYRRSYPTGVTRTIEAQFERVYLAGDAVLLSSILRP